MTAGTGTAERGGEDLLGGDGVELWGQEGHADVTGGIGGTGQAGLVPSWWPFLGEAAGDVVSPSAPEGHVGPSVGSEGRLGPPVESEGHVGPPVGSEDVWYHQWDLKDTSPPVGPPIGSEGPVGLPVGFEGPISTCRTTNRI